MRFEVAAETSAGRVRPSTCEQFTTIQYLFDMQPVLLGVPDIRCFKHLPEGSHMSDFSRSCAGSTSSMVSVILLGE